jgi:hypothetical protein
MAISLASIARGEHPDVRIAAVPADQVLLVDSKRLLAQLDEADAEKYAKPKKPVEWDKPKKKPRRGI